MSHQEELRTLITNHQRRLQKLREQNASFGMYAPPHILTQIEDIETEIEDLQTQLKELETREIERRYLLWLKEKYQEWGSQFAPRSANVENRSQTIRPEMWRLLKQASNHQMKRYEGDLFDIVKQYHRLTLLGKPGGGKTTLVQMVAYRQAQLALTNKTAPLPVLIRLGDYTTSEEFRDFLIRHLKEQIGNWANFIPEYLDKGRLWLLLDGLDEMPVNDYEDRVDNLNNFLTHHPENKFLITCRTNEYPENKFDYQKAELQPLDKLQIRDFVKTFLQKEGEIMFQALETQDLFGLADNPYILRMLTLLFEAYGDLPQDNDETIGQFVNVLLEREKNLVRRKGIEKDLVPLTLAHLALNLALLGYRGVSVERNWAKLQIPSFLPFNGESVPINQEKFMDVAVGATILVPGPNKKTVRFYHQLFQKFFLEQYELKNLALQQFEALLQPISVAEKMLLEQAYAVAEITHQEQRRYSGDPYIYHAIAVTLNSIRMAKDPDLEMVAASLTHDVGEAGQAMLDKVGATLGPDILNLVNEVTEVGKKVRAVGQEVDDKTLDTLLASFDGRAIFIKLADRLHNMQTIRFISSKNKQDWFTIETRQVYVPLAQRAGYAQLAIELHQTVS